MRQGPRAEPPLDPRWLDLLVERCRDLRNGGSRFVDLYFEQRLEMRAALSDRDFELETCQLEGIAVRWRSPTRTILEARTGISAAAIGDALAPSGTRVSLPATRPLPAPELDPPRSWFDWAREVVERTRDLGGSVRYLSRRSAVVHCDGWTTISSPALVRVECGGEQPAALLAVWRHRETTDWLHALTEPAAKKPWSPEPGAALPVLFSEGTAGALMHEVVGHMAESDLVLSGASPLASLQGATISTPGLNVGDDPTRFDLPGAFDHDDEGVPARALNLVRDGRFENFLCDGPGARALAGSAGRARRSVWSRPPVARLSNLVVTAGDTAPEVLEADMEHGLVVTRVGSATVDPAASRLVLGVERGWEVRRGRRRRPLGPCRLSGQIMRVLAGIDPRVGNDPKADWRLGWCIKDGLSLPTGSEAPSLLVVGFEVL